MEVENRKRKDDGKTEEKIQKAVADDGGTKRVAPPPPDEEVEEFFAIVKRIRVALNYFQRRDGEAAKPSWSPSFQREDFAVVDPDPGSSHSCGKPGLDLNSDPVSDASDSV